MCGLVGVIDGGGGARDGVERALDALHHRGPDGRGRWASEDGRVHLGHARLGVVAPWDSAQPLVSEDGQVVALVNGELYNWREQRRALEARGHRFATSTDSEVVLHLYEELGDGLLKELRGEFAFIVWDARRGRLLAARDPYGVRPLVWARHEQALWLASEAKALFAAGLPATWDFEALHQALSLQYLLPEQTLFGGVHQLGPGMALSWQAGVVRTWRWWHPPPAHPEAWDLEQSAERLEAALDEAVALRLQADVPVACQLSGGVDSAAVLALAARHGPPPQAFTIGFDHDDYDERALAEAVARHVGATLHVLHLDQPTLLDTLPDAVAQGEGLVINLHAAAKLRLARAVKAAGYTVLLSGEGSDELLGGYAHFRLDRGEAHVGSDAVAGVHLPEGDGLSLRAAQAKLGFLPGWLQAKATLGHRQRTVLARGFVQAFGWRDPAAALVDAVPVPEGPRWRRSAALWSQTCLAGYILRVLGDGMEAGASLEGRPPLLDPAVAAVAARLPDDVLWHPVGGAPLEKAALRHALGGKLPEAVRTRPKHPFMAPPASALPEVFLQDWLSSAALSTLPFYDARALRTLADRLPGLSPRERAAWDPVLWMAVSAAMLARTYGL